MGAHWNSIVEAILVSTHDIGFYEELTKNIFQLSSNTHIISSDDNSDIYDLNHGVYPEKK